MSHPRFRRQQKLIKPRFQLKLAGAFLLGSFAAVMLTTWLVRGATGDLMKLAALDPDGAYQVLMRVLVVKALLALAILLPLILLFSVSVTFRFAGPVYRFEKFLEAVLRGEQTEPCRLRAGDELQDLCYLLNQVTASKRAETAAMRGAEVPAHGRVLGALETDRETTTPRPEAPVAESSVR